MASKKRSKVDAAVLNEPLPLNSLQLYEQNNHSLKKSLDQYRKDNEALNRKNVLVSRRIEALEALLSSVSSLWDSLNGDIDLYLSRQVSASTSSGAGVAASDPGSAEEDKGSFWEKMASTKLPFAAPGAPEDGLDLDELNYMFDNDEFLLPEESYDEAEWEREKQEYLGAKVDLFESKKDALLRSVTRARSHPKFDTSGVVEVLKYNCLHFGKMYFLIHDRYRKLRDTYNSLKVEISRLNKQIAFLKFELKGSKDEPKKDQDVSSSGESDHDPVKVVENVEEVTEEMIVGSSLYSRLFSYAKNMDREIVRLEAENTDLQTRLSHLAEKPGDDVAEFKSRYDEIVAELRERVATFEAKFLEATRELSQLSDSYRFVQEELEHYKAERLNMIEELNQRETTMVKLLHQNAAICKSMSASNVSTATDLPCPDPEPDANAVNPEGSGPGTPSAPSFDEAFYKEQLMNISEELEEVSLAFEKKQKMCDELMRQVNEAQEGREKLAKLEVSYTTLVDRFNKLVTATNTKVASQVRHSQDLEKLVSNYRESWAHAFKRASFMQRQRDAAVSAVCELQAQYRRSCRAQKALQDYLAHVRTGVARASSLESSLGDVDNVISQENEILRRRMTCTVCSENFRDHVITKCGHVFCHGCLASNLRSRNRKCPQCKIAFDKNDTQRIFLD